MAGEVHEHGIRDHSMYRCMLMRDEEGRKKEASKVKQTTRQSNTTHPRQSLFQRKNELPRVGLEPKPLYTLDVQHRLTSYVEVNPWAVQVHPRW